MSAARLNPGNLPAPGLAYARGAYLAQGGVVHLGIGAFHRAHQAVYFDQLAELGVPGFAVTGVSLRSTDVATQLNPQAGLYGVLQLAEGEESMRWIGVQQATLHAPTQSSAVMAALCSARTWLVSLTITEKGYCHFPASGELNFAHPDIVHDLSTVEAPRTAIALITRALQARFNAGIPSFTVLCCDNLPHNGKLLRALVVRFAQAIDPVLADRIASEVAFPCSMVDRIVPATTEADRARVQQRFGVDDQGLVKAEPFSQWVIEAGDARLQPLQRVGVLLVDDVAPFETMKLRLLNGSHSMLAYLGYLAGHEFVSQAMQGPGFEILVRDLMRAEVQPTLIAPSGFDLHQYQKDLYARFSNAALQHRTWQIAMDGSQKIPQRWLGTILDLLAQQKPMPVLNLALAAWLRYVRGVDELGARIDVRDPLQAQFAELAGHARDDVAYVNSVLELSQILPPSLRANQPWRNGVLRSYQHLADVGSAAAVRALAGQLTKS
jgi:fructuronate reductase